MKRGKSRRNATPARLCVCDPLEKRVLLSTITWTNRNTFSGVGDNRFDDVFGALANQAIAVIDADLNYWQRVIDNFNYNNGSNTYSVTISMNASAIGSGPGGVGANAGVTGTIGGKPSSANVGIGWRSGITPGTNSAAGWYLDPTPMDNSEFGYNVNGFTAVPGRNLGGGDLFTGVLHELGHAMGLSSNSTINAFATNTGVTDIINTPASVPVSTYWRFDSDRAHTLWTSWDSGGAGPSGATNANGAQHFAPVGAQLTANGRTYYGAVDLMNAVFTNRSIIDDNLVYMLEDAYGYSVTPPSRFGTFYDRLDADGTLNISTLSSGGSATSPFTRSSGPDHLDLQVSGGTLLVTLDLGAPVNGIDPSSIVSTFPLASISAINITLGGGFDTVTIRPISDSVPITLSMNSFDGSDDGPDVLNVWGTNGYNQLTVDDPSLTSNGVHITQFQGVGTFNYYTNNGHNNIDLPDTGLISQMTVNGSNGDEVMSINSIDADTALVVYGGGGSDDISVPVGPVTVSGGLGDDSINIGIATDVLRDGQFISLGGDEGTDTFGLFDFSENPGRTYDIFDDSGIAVVDGSRELYYGDMEKLDLHESVGDDVTTLIGLKATTSAQIEDLGGNDTLTIKDQQAGAFTNYFLGAGTFTSTAGGSAAYEGVEHFDFFGRDDGATTTIGNLDSSTAQIRIFAGASSNDSLILDDSASLAWRFDLSEDTITHFLGTPEAPDPRSSEYHGYESISLDLADTTTTQNIWGVPALPGHQLTLSLGYLSDTTTIHPHDAEGNLTIHANIGILGGSGADSLTVDDTDSSAPLHYGISNPFGADTQDILGIGTGGVAVGAYKDIEAIVLNAGQGDDTFDINSFKTGQGLSILGNGGDDSINLTPQGKDLAANITAIHYTSFDGGAGNDALNLRNDNSDSQWVYTQTNGYLKPAKLDGSYYLILTYPNIESIFASGGTNVDRFDVESVPAGVAVEFDGAGSYDSYILENQSLTQDILGSVSIDGSAADQTLHVIDSADTTGRTFHIGAGALGNIAGDNLFGPGGSLHYNGGITLEIVCGSGADTVFAAPDPNSLVLLEAGNPSAAPGDTLNLGLSQAQNYVLHGTPDSGSVTSDNLKAIGYDDFETGPGIDDVAPIATAAIFEPNPGAAPALRFDFSEAMSGDPAAGMLTLRNLSTGQTVDPDLLAVGFAGNSITFTFPGFEDGLLPAGIYQATLAAGAVADLAGNHPADDSSFSFLNVPAGQHLALAPGNSAFRVQQLAIGSGGSIDLADNDLIVHGGGLGSWNGSAYTGISGLLQSGVIFSSAAQNRTTGLGAATASSIFGISGAQTALFDGQTVSASDVLIKFTYVGDANLDGKINIDDYGRIDSNVGQSGFVFGWYNGDFNFDGKINIDDYGLIDSVIGAQGPVL